jgi:hypothetical protein
MNHAPLRFQRCLATLKDIGGRLRVTRTVQSGAAIAQEFLNEWPSRFSVAFREKTFKKSDREGIRMTK